MKNDKSYDAFADLNIGDSSRYDERNKDALKQERAEALDNRIRAFCNREKNLEWAKSAHDFCDSEELANRDILDLSAEAHRFDIIREEADHIIRNDKRAKEEAKAAGLRNISKKAYETDNLIKTLDESPRSKYWAKDVKDVDKEVQSLARDVKLQMKNLPVLDRLMSESRAVENAAMFDDSVHAVRVEKPHNKAWAERVIKVINDIEDDAMPYMAEARFVASLKEEANDIIDAALKAAHQKKIDEDNAAKDKEAREARAAKEKAEKPKVRPYESFINKFNSSSLSATDVKLSDGDVPLANALIDDFDSLDSKIVGLGFQLSEYINDFDSKWSRIGAKIGKLRSAVGVIEDRIERVAKDKENRATSQRFEMCLDEVESGNYDSAFDSFVKLDKEIPKLDFILGDYIADFNSRWNSARKTLKDEKARRDKAARDKKAKEDEEKRIAAEAAAAAAAKEKAKQQKRAKNAWKRRGYAALGVNAGVCLALVILAFIFKDIADWFFGGAIGFAIMYSLSIGIPVTFGIYSPKGVTHPVKILTLVAAFGCMIMGEYIYASCLFGSVFVGAFMDMIVFLIAENMFDMDDEYDDDYRFITAVYASIATIMLPITVGITLGGIAQPLVLGFGLFAALILINVLPLVFVEDIMLQEAWVWVTGIAFYPIIITAIVFMFLSPLFFFVGVCVALGVCVSAIIAFCFEASEECWGILAVPAILAFCSVFFGLPMFFANGCFGELFRPDQVAEAIRLIVKK